MEHKKKKSKLKLADVLDRSRKSKYEKEAEKVDKALMDYVVMPAKKLGGEKGQAVGSGIAAGLSSLHSLLRKPDDSVVKRGELPGMRKGFNALYYGGKAPFKRAAPTVAREIKKAGEVAKGQLSNMEMAKIIRKFAEKNKWYKAPENITGNNVKQEFERLGRTIQAIQKKQ